MKPLQIMNMELELMLASLPIMYNSPAPPNVKSKFKIILKSQPKVIARLRKEIEYFSKAIEVTREKHKSEKDFDKAYPKMFAIFNAFIFFRLSFLDIMVLNISYFKTKDELEKQVFAKLLALSFYEFFQDVPRIFGKQFLQSFERYKTPSSESELRYFQRLLNKMKELSIDELKLIPEGEVTILEVYVS